MKIFYDEDLIWKIQIDTYQREIERYGEKTMEISEDFFFYDSVLILELLKKVIKDDENLRWQISLILINNILSNFSFSTLEKLKFIEELRNGFAAEFSIDKFFTKQLDLKYRVFREEIDDIMQIKSHRELNFNKYISDFNKETIFVFDDILQKKNLNELEINFNSLVSSFIHMSMVRLFKSKNRLHELVVYDFLLKYYKTCIARGFNI